MAPARVVCFALVAAPAIVDDVLLIVVVVVAGTVGFAVTGPTTEPRMREHQSNLTGVGRQRRDENCPFQNAPQYMR